MFVHSFRFDSSQFQSRVRNAFEPRKPRHRLLRFGLGLVGLGVLVLLVMFSVFVGAAMIAAGVVYRLWSKRGKPMSHRPHVVDGEFSVVDRPVLGRSGDATSGARNGNRATH